MLEHQTPLIELLDEALGFNHSYDPIAEKAAEEDNELRAYLDDDAYDFDATANHDRMDMDGLL